MIDGSAAASRSRRPCFGIFVHQEADRAAVHAVDRLRRLHRHVQGLQHQAVAAERDDDVGLVERAVAVERRSSLSSASLASFAPDDRKAIVCVRAAGVTTDMLTSPARAPARSCPSAQRFGSGAVIAAPRARRRAKRRRASEAEAALRPRAGCAAALRAAPLGGRQLDEKPRAAIEVVRLGRRERDRPAVSGHEVGGDRQAEAGAGLARRLVERLEDPLGLIGGKSGTGVADLDQRQPVGADRGEANGFRPSVLGAFGHQRLGGVAAQVLEHAQNVVRIGVDAEPRRNVDIVVDRVASLSACADSTTCRTSSLRSKRRRDGGSSRPAP